MISYIQAAEPSWEKYYTDRFRISDKPTYNTYFLLGKKSAIFIHSLSY